MKKLLWASVAISISAIGFPVLGADLPDKAPPVVAPVPAFTWSSCYIGGHVGGAWARNDVTDPAQLVQDTFLGLGSTAGVTTASATPNGYLIGGQFGCDYQFATNLVVGAEGAFSGGNIRSRTSVPLPLGNLGESALVTTQTDFIPSATLRLGYAWGRWLLYVKGGAAWVDDKYSVIGTFQGTGFDFEGLDFRTGWTVGGGAEWALWENWSARLEYDYYDFGNKSLLMSDSTNVLSGPVNAKQSVQTVKFSLNFHMWSSD